MTFVIFTVQNMFTCCETTQSSILICKYSHPPISIKCHFIFQTLMVCFNVFPIRGKWLFFQGTSLYFLQYPKLKKCRQYPKNWYVATQSSILICKYSHPPISIKCHFIFQTFKLNPFWFVSTFSPFGANDVFFQGTSLYFLQYPQTPK